MEISAVKPAVLVCMLDWFCLGSIGEGLIPAYVEIAYKTLLWFYHELRFQCSTPIQFGVDPGMSVWSSIYVDLRQLLIIFLLFFSDGLDPIVCFLCNVSNNTKDIRMRLQSIQSSIKITQE
jgi:hypothetical protein